MPTDVERRPGWLGRLKLRVKKMLGMKTILCDTWKWDWRSACHHTERPNATWCPDYEKRGSSPFFRDEEDQQWMKDSR